MRALPRVTVVLTLALTHDQLGMLRRNTEVDLLNARHGVDRLRRRRMATGRVPKMAYIHRQEAWVAALEELLAQLPGAEGPVS